MLQVRRCWAISLLSPAIRPCRLSFSFLQTPHRSSSFLPMPRPVRSPISKGAPNSTRSSTPRGLVVLRVQPPAAPNRRCGCCKWTSPSETRVHEIQDGYSERLFGRGHPGETPFSTTLSQFPSNGEMIRKCMTLRCAKPGSIRIFETSRMVGPRGPRWDFKGARMVRPITSARLACRVMLRPERREPQLVFSTAASI